MSVIQSVGPDVSGSKRGLHRHALLALVMLPWLLTACDTPNPAVTFPELTFAHKAKFKLNVAKIEVINEYRMPFKEPNVEHLVPIAPGAAAERWAADILKPVGTRGTALFVITRASVTKKNLKMTSGLKGLIAIEQSEEYEAGLDARIEILDGNRRTATAKTSITRTQTAREDVTPNQRSKLWYTLVERLMLEFDGEMRKQGDTYLREDTR
jgi:hypothetical protein